MPCQDGLTLNLTKLHHLLKDPLGSDCGHPPGPHLSVAFTFTSTSAVVDYYLKGLGYDEDDDQDENFNESGMYQQSISSHFMTLVESHVFKFVVCE
jgi:hypothetical protein